MKAFSALLLFFLISGVAVAQVPTVTLSGKVVSDSTGEPLVKAHVFIASSMIGTTTDREGNYRLDDVPVGAHRLFVTTVGYKSEALDVMLRPRGEHRYDFRLKPEVVEYNEVTIEAKQDKKWKSRLEKFTELFIGKSANAEQVKIVNPYVLDFDETLGRFVARTDSVLVIENRALGYRVRYFLKEFGATGGRTWYDGEPLFEELEPANEEEADRWKQNRLAAFMGSFRHFALAMLAGRLDEQGFKVYSRPAFSLTDSGADTSPAGGAINSRFPLKDHDMFKDGENINEKLLDFQGAVEIIYTGEYEDKTYHKWLQRNGESGAGLYSRKERFQSSWIQLDKGPTVIDYKGDVLDPYGVTFIGYLAFERVADELPKEYRPQ